MRNRLMPCSSCARHIQERESTCPFCATPVPAGQKAPESYLSTRMSRGAALALGITLSACGGATTPAPDPGGEESSGEGEGDGEDLGGDETPGPDGGDAGPPNDIVAPMYGIAPPEPGPPEASGPPEDDGGMMTKYGAPAPPEE